MFDRHDYAAKEGSRGETAPSDAENTRALQAYVNRETGLSLPASEDGANYVELFARLQKLIDNATQTIRDLRRENADLSGRVSQLDAYIQMRAEVVGNEEELQKSAARLEELLTLQGTIPEAVSPPAAPTPLRAFEPMPPPPAMPPVETARESAPTTLNGYAPMRETPPYTPPAPSLPPVEPAMPAFTAPVLPPEPPRTETTPYMPPTMVETTPYVPPTMEEAAAYEPRVMNETATIPYPPTPPVMPMPRAPEPVIEAETIPHAPVISQPAVVPAEVTAPAPITSGAETILAPIRRPTPAPVSGNEKVAGTYTLVVYPFTRFSDLGQFQSVLQELVGIHDVQVRRFAQGTLEMRLGYDGVTPLPQALHNLSVRIENVEEEEPYRLRVRLDLNHAS